MRKWLGAVVFIAAIHAEGELTAQGLVDADDRLLCEVSLDELGSGVSSARAPFSQPTAVRAIGTDSLVLSSAQSDGGVLLFSRTPRGEGVYSASSIYDGFGMVQDVQRVSQDTFLIVDSGRQSVALMALGDETWRREISVPADTWSALPIRDDRILINADVRFAHTIGLPLHLMSSVDGTVSASFGELEHEIVYRWDMPFPIHKRVTIDDQGNVWAADVNEYRIDAWTETGTHLVRIERRPPWFQYLQPGTRTLFDPEQVPASRVRDIVLRGDTLWVMVNVAGPDWRAQLRFLPDLDAHDVVDRGEFYDTIIDVLHTQTGALLARVHMPEFGVGFASEEVLVTYREPPGGPAEVRLWAFEVCST